MKRLKFCIVAVHALVQSGEALDNDALDGLREILESIALDYTEERNDNR